MIPINEQLLTEKVQRQIQIAANVLKSWYLEYYDANQLVHLMILEESELITGRWGGDVLKYVRFRLLNRLRDAKDKMRNDALCRTHVTFEWAVGVIESVRDDKDYDDMSVASALEKKSKGLHGSGITEA